MKIICNFAIQIQRYGQIGFHIVLHPFCFPADANENRRHIHVVKRGDKHSHKGDTVAKIWIEENGKKKIEVDWSELSADDEALIIEAIDDNWEELNLNIDKVFAGKKIQIKKYK